jgi:hypothetical protein
MLSTFDLTLLGSLVSAGGLAFLGQAQWPHLGWRSCNERRSANLVSTFESRDRLERSTTIAGSRWLTVGALTLFVAYAHGAEEGYLFNPWGDVLFHVIFVSTCWGATAFRMKQAAERQTGQTNDSPISALSLPGTTPSRTGD